MNEWELTDEEISKLPKMITTIAMPRPSVVAQASNKKLVEWLDRQYGCKNPEDMAHHWLLISPEDWQKLLKGVGIEPARTSENS